MKPIWQGPSGKGLQGGVTPSLLSKFLVCRERFKAHALEGIRSRPRFSHKLEYGLLYHLAEETYAQGGDWREAVVGYGEKLAEKYPFDRDEIDKWCNVCLIQFPVYLDYWKARPEPTPVQPVLREEAFDVPYTLPSGRVVRLRGRMDGVDLIDGVLWLHEKKTKGEVDEAAISRQLTYDLQTMTYLIALPEHMKKYRVDGALAPRVQGVRYDVTRRPLSGGKGTIVQKKGSKNVPAESKAEYYERLAQYIREEPETYFFRWRVDVAPGDIQRFKDKTLDPLLEFMCCWYDLQTGTGVPHGEMLRSCLHWQTPYGVFNPLDQGGETDLDMYLTHGDMTGLVKVQETFPELNEVR